MVRHSLGKLRCLVGSFAVLLLVVPVAVHVHLLPEAVPHHPAAHAGLQAAAGAQLTTRTTSRAYSPHTRNLLATLLRNFNGGPVATGPGSGGVSSIAFNATPALVVRPEGGLSNRMRALASARAYADLTGRRLVVVWLQDAHCRAAYHDLFLADDGLHVLSEPIEDAITAAATEEPW
jgi:hypothetical protein